MSQCVPPAAERFPVTYALYSHYSIYERSDLKAFRDAKKQGANLTLTMRETAGIQHLSKYFSGFDELLGTPGHEGILILFFAAGLESLLDNLSRTRAELLKDYEDLEFAAHFAEAFAIEVKERHLERRVRLITSLDLHDILGRVGETISEKAHGRVTGPEPGIRYDAPKIPEAIVRLRLLGHGVPVLRLDQDVLLRDHTIADLGLFKAVSCTVLAYKLRLQDSSVATFMFSGSYNAKALVDRTLVPDPFEAWSGAFATRIHPALFVDLNKIKTISDIQEPKIQEIEWETYAKAHFDPSIASAYFGLRPSLVEAEWREGLTEIGAHPFHSVISGALLCLSEGAILDLPPFSNFRFNVMWIDDHLKYSLHREMRHFTSPEELELVSNLGSARLDGVFVTKARPPISNLPGYTMGVYLPTLLWGTVVDSWITLNSVSKVRHRSLSAAEKSEWNLARSSTQQAPLPRAMRETLRRGSFDDHSRDQLRRQLTDSAVRRIEMVRERWTNLPTSSRGLRTFASYWAAGEVEGVFPSAQFQNFDKRWWKGLTKVSISSLEQLPSPIAIAIMDLVEDAVNYVTWTLEWPTYIQVVRSIEQGTFVGDMTWRPLPS